MTLHTETFSRSILVLETSLSLLEVAEVGSIQCDIFECAVEKGFELALEMAERLLRQALKVYTGRPRDIDALTYKDLLRHATKHALVTTEEVERWFAYRDNRNNTAHDYGVGFAEDTVKLLPGFIKDAKRLETVLRERLGNGEA